MIHWLAQGTEDAPRQPSDILVLAPNLKELEPAIRSVFAPPPREREGNSQRLQKIIYIYRFRLPGYPDSMSAMPGARYWAGFSWCIDVSVSKILPTGSA